jgi:hypothetical protein
MTLTPLKFYSFLAVIGLAAFAFDVMHPAPPKPPQSAAESACNKCMATVQKLAFAFCQQRGGGWSCGDEVRQMADLAYSGAPEGGCAASCPSK